MTIVLLSSLAGILVAFLCLWVISLRIHDVSIVDMFWGAGFVLIAWLSLAVSGTLTSRALTLAVLITIWGSRLSGYLIYRNWGKEEDKRYAKMREKHGDRFPWVSLFTVFLLQAVLAWIISLPVQVAMVYSVNTWWIWVYFGIAVWAVGLFFESVGDYQMARFKADSSNSGKVMNLGLWRYTRHPNYFGDFLVWWGIYLIAAEAIHWWWTIIGPLLMSFLLLRVSGVTLLESSLKSRLDGYETYVRRTSAFVPMPPKDLDKND